MSLQIHLGPSPEKLKEEEKHSTCEVWSIGMAVAGADQRPKDYITSPLYGPKYVF